MTHSISSFITMVHIAYIVTMFHHPYRGGITTAWDFAPLHQYLAGSKVVVFLGNKLMHSNLSCYLSTRCSTGTDRARMVLMAWLDNIEVKYIEVRKIAHVDALCQIIHHPGRSDSEEGRGGVRECYPVKARDFDIRKD
jgi:hypothetical protein